MATFTTNNYYKTTFQNGDTIFILIGEKLKNGAYKAKQVESYRGGKAKQCTTSFLVASQWTQIAPTAIPTKLFAKF